MTNDKNTNHLDTVEAIFKAGYTENSDLYTLLLNLESKPHKKFSTRLMELIELSKALKKMSVVDEVEREIQGLYNFYYVDLREKVGYVHIYDDFNCLVYTCEGKELEGAFSTDNWVAREAIRNHLISRKIMKSMDILVI